MTETLGNRVYSVWAAGTQERGQSYGPYSVFFERRTMYSYGYSTMAYRQDNLFVVNSDISNPATSAHQNNVRAVIGNRSHILLPFSALRRAGILPKDIELIEREPDREISINRKDKPAYLAHLMGRSAFRVGDSYYLSGIDEGAADLWRAYFLVKLPRPVISVADAVESLKPANVAQAKGVLRQGEYFFIPLSEGLPNKGVKEQSLLIDSGHHKATELRRVNGFLVARGTVRHTQRNHKMLRLGAIWHRVERNLALASYPADGRVD